MISVLVQFKMDQQIPADKMAELSLANAPLYKGVDGLHRKYYLWSDGGSTVGGLYLWDSREQAEAVYNGEWRDRVVNAYGCEPEMTWFDCPVVLDNRHDEIVHQP